MILIQKWSWSILTEQLLTSSSILCEQCPGKSSCNSINQIPQLKETAWFPPICLPHWSHQRFSTSQDQNGYWQNLRWRGCGSEGHFGSKCCIWHHQPSFTPAEVDKSNRDYWEGFCIGWRNISLIASSVSWLGLLHHISLLFLLAFHKCLFCTLCYSCSTYQSGLHVNSNFKCDILIPVMSLLYFFFNSSLCSSFPSSFSSSLL